jgi:hypothetical protein
MRPAPAICRHRVMRDGGTGNVDPPHPSFVRALPLAALRLVVVALATAALLSACGKDLPTDPTSAPAAADRVGCKRPASVDVPKDWGEYDQAVECGLEGADVVIVWKKAKPGEGNTGIICEAGTQAECDAAMEAYRREVSND